MTSPQSAPRITRGGRRRSSGPGFAVLLVLTVIASAAAGALVARTLHRTKQTRAASVAVPPQPAAAPSTPSAPTGPPTLLTAGTEAVPIIMYHDVLPRKQVWFDMLTPDFRQQMDDLARAGAHPVSMQQLYDHLADGKPLPDHAIALTFDDCTLGQFTQALPILERYRFKATFFVQTASVGVTTEKEHMTWDQLREAEKTGLITVESHTVTHPEDITQVSDDQLQMELQDSKQAIEQHLGHPVRFLAYPSGNCDARVSQAAMDAGYLAAVTMDRGWAASPAQALFLPRLIPRRLPEALAAWSGAGPIAPPLASLTAIRPAPITMGVYTGGRFPVQWLAGGALTTESLDTRETVGEMAHAVKAEAALNGTFFADARIAGKGGAMIGPVVSSITRQYEPSVSSEDPRLEGRPLVLISPTQCLVLPYDPHLGHSLAVLQQLMPDVKDAFLAGGWIVHQGKCLPQDQMARWSSSDFNDPRHRSFVGIDSQHRYLLGATQDSIGCYELGQILQQMGVQEAWLLDSGFSTSLIWRNRVLVSGHSEIGVPSRPVPHALFLSGQLATDAPTAPDDLPEAWGPQAATLQDALSADSTAGARHYWEHHRRTRRWRRRRYALRRRSPAASAGAAEPAGASSQPASGGGSETDQSSSPP